MNLLTGADILISLIVPDLFLFALANNEYCAKINASDNYFVLFRSVAYFFADIYCFIVCRAEYGTTFIDFLRFYAHAFSVIENYEADF